MSDDSTRPPTSSDGPEQGALLGEAEPGTGRRSPALLITLSVLAVLLLIPTVILGSSWHDRRVAAADRADAVSIGRQTALNVFSFDYRKVEAQLKVIQREAGGRFATEFANSKDALIKVVKAEQRISTSRVVEVGVVTATSTSVQIVVALNEFRITKAAPKGSPVLQRVLLNMAKTKGAWKLVDLRPVA